MFLLTRDLLLPFHFKSEHFTSNLNVLHNVSIFGFWVFVWWFNVCVASVCNVSKRNEDDAPGSIQD